MSVELEAVASLMREYISEGGLRGALKLTRTLALIAGDRSRMADSRRDADRWREFAARLWEGQNRTDLEEEFFGMGKEFPG